MRGKIFAICLAAAALLMCGTAYAGEWKNDEKGYWYDNGDGTYPVNAWQWIDGNGDGTAESYFFGPDGYLLVSVTTPDGFEVNSDGAWTVDGNVQVKIAAGPGATQSGALSSPEQKAEILSAYRNFLEHARSFHMARLDVFNAVPDDEASGRAYLAANLPATKEHLGPAIAELDRVAELCGDYADTQEIKQNVQERRGYIAELQGLEYTSENVIDQLAKSGELTQASEDLGGKVIEIMNKWVEGLS